MQLAVMTEGAIKPGLIGDEQIVSGVALQSATCDYHTSEAISIIHIHADSEVHARIRLKAEPEAIVGCDGGQVGKIPIAWVGLGCCPGSQGCHPFEGCRASRI